MPRRSPATPCQRPGDGAGVERYRLRVVNRTELRLTRSWGPLLALMLACEPSGKTTPPDPTPSGDGGPSAQSEPVPDDVGGRLYDRFYRELELEFDPGKAGGPNGDGTLNDGSGEPMPNDGHDYRLKNLFGWDLRGAEGIYGPEYQGKGFVRSFNLLTDTRTVDELATWLTNGDDVVPAYGEVLSPEQILGIATFIDRVRTGVLPGPSHVFALSSDAPKNYTLATGADIARGKQLYADKCAGCHGDDTRKIAVDGDQSIGLFMRRKAYEGWIKVVNGHPASPMGREIEFSSGQDGGEQIRDIIAALCDRTAYPSMDGVEDVPDGDARCGAYLK